MTIEELNECMTGEDANEFIRVSEARQVKAISKIADVACGRAGIRLVLLCGASSAGKTTTAKRICTQLRVNYRNAMLLSTDDYFVGDARNPRDEQGNLDYEHIDCVDIPLLSADILTLLDGGQVRQRKFDFVRHEGFYTHEKLSLAKGGFIVLEGIHALNPRLTEGIPDSAKYRVFADPQPDLDVFGGIMLSSANVRFLRRLVRDNRYRKMSPMMTLGMWPKVMEGEEKWIAPFKGNADAVFDSYLPYELAVLKPYAAGLLEMARLDGGQSSFVMNMIRLLSIVVPAPADAVPGDSILRETIGGSQLEY